MALVLPGLVCHGAWYHYQRRWLSTRSDVTALFSLPIESKTRRICFAVSAVSLEMVVGPGCYATGDLAVVCAHVLPGLSK